MNRIQRLFVPTLLMLLSACGSLHSPNLRLLGVSADKPSHVSVFFDATRDGQPLSELDAKSFTIYEDGQPLDPSEVQQTLLLPEVAAARRTLLLVDLSAAGSDAVRRELARAQDVFVDTVRRSQAVSVYAFDGGASIRLLRELERDASPSKSNSELPPRPRDPSRNLNGAVVQAISQLEARLAQSALPVRVGTLVVFSAGPDLAGRATNNSLAEKLDHASLSVLGIGIGDDQKELRDIGRDGYVDAHSKDTLSLGFEEAAHRVDALARSNYLLSYCSPARAARRSLRVKLTVKDAQGKLESASLESEFDATGFSPGCDAHATPRFVRPKGDR